jgi:hypothetical protein
MIDRVRVWLRLAVEDVKFRMREVIRRNLRKLIEIALTDLDLMSAFTDTTSSVAFEKAHLGEAAAFGVYKGDSINRLAGLRADVHWHGFDSFIGLPEAWTLGSRRGAFSVAGKLPAVRHNVTLIKGFFEDTLAPFAAAHRGEKIAFLHVDCDLYSATRTIFKELHDMLQPGAIVLFDEFINYPGWQEGEYKAFMAFTTERKRSFEYIGYVRTGGQVAVRLT